MVPCKRLSWLLISNEQTLKRCTWYRFLHISFATLLSSPSKSCVFVRSVAAGVDHFKHGRQTEAMQMFNKALQIDADNVDALVARGAM